MHDKARTYLNFGVFSTYSAALVTIYFKTSWLCVRRSSVQFSNWPQGVAVVSGVRPDWKSSTMFCFVLPCDYCFSALLQYDIDKEITK